MSLVTPRALLFFVLLLGTSRHSFASGCPTGVPIATLKLSALPAKGGPPLPLNALNVASLGEKLRYEPVKLPDDLRSRARVSVIIVPAGDADAKHFTVLAAQPVKDPAEWLIPQTASAIGLIFGSYGIDAKRVTSLVQKHPEIVTKLADYAEESTRVEALVQTLSQYEKSPPTGKSLQSVLQGFSAQYGLQLPPFDSKTASSQQVLGLLKAIAPAVNTQDPLLSRNDMVVKAGGLAESVAVSYFGAPAALTVGGAALVQSLHSSLFPPTNFRSAFAQPSDSGATNLCSAKNEDKETRAHIDYIWMSRIPNQEAPNVSLKTDAHVLVGMTSLITVSTATVAQLEHLSRARNWSLISGTTAIPVPVKINAGSSSGTIVLDLSESQLAPGQYQLTADWDWTPFRVNGTVEIHSPGDVVNVQLTAVSRDALISGTGPLQIRMTGIDFEFVDSIVLVQPGKPQKPILVQFTLPKGKQLGSQPEMEAEVDTAKLVPGEYALTIRQVNGATGEVPITIHPPNPTLTEIPLRVNVGEAQQTIILHGRHLERIEKISSAGAAWILRQNPEGAVDLNVRSLTIKLSPTARKGDQLSAEIFVNGLAKPLRVDGMARIAGPRPKITGVTKSFASESGIELRDGEIPAGTPMSFALEAKGVDSHPVIKLGCRNETDIRRTIAISPGDRNDSAELDVTGRSSFYLSVDPGVIGDSGCQLTAVVNDQETGTSEPFMLGRVTRLPHISSFMVTDEKLGEASFAGSLTGQDLQLISKASWSVEGGEPVQGIATPIPGNSREQTLKISVPWPPPAPRAPLYIWLRGENDARQTNARY